MMPARLVFDTDVLVDFLRGRTEAASFLRERTEALLLCSVTVAELFAGVREGRERTALNALLGAFEILPVDRAVAERGGLYRREFGRSHGTGLADALVAAASESIGARLVTLNARHFPMLTDLLIPYTKS